MLSMKDSPLNRVYSLTLTFSASISCETVAWHTESNAYQQHTLKTIQHTMIYIRQKYNMVMLVNSTEHGVSKATKL